jgi:deoxyribodipyrimidine photo-lyase
MSVPSILWFKRDLRLADHPALACAAAAGPVVPLYIAEPEGWAQPDASGRQWAFVAEGLAELRADLAVLGQPLIVRRGEAVAVLSAIARATGAARIVSHEETGLPCSWARDRRVAAWARDAGLDWLELPQSGVVRRLRSRDGWAARRDGFVAAAQAAPPVALAPVDLEPGAIPPAAALGLAADRCAGRQGGGRARGLTALERFLDRGAAGYRRGMSSPLTASETCSRLSPHLAWGTLSVREVAQAAQARAEGAAGPAKAGLAAFAARLAWRDHFTQKLEDAPWMAERCLHPMTEALRPRQPDALRLAAWSAGETGLPFVDACLRALAATGWINFRMRAMLISVASYHLWLDWRATGPVLARMFTDYDPGIHWPQVQMQSGTTGINLPRIYNPVKQGQDQDPDGRFTRRWCPELAAVPDRYLQTPWTWPEAGRLLGRRYPEPLVDPAAAARAARDAVWGLRARPGFAEAAAEIVRQHASRADPARRFVNDRAPRPRRAPTRAPKRDAGQMEFDL